MAAPTSREERLVERASSMRPRPAVSRRVHAILRFDSGAGITVGIVVLALRDWLAELYALPVPLVSFVAAANLTYGCCSGTLAVLAWRGREPARRAMELLAIANLAWACVCAGLLVATWPSASVYGRALLALEALFVGTLGAIEHRVVSRSQ